MTARNQSGKIITHSEATFPMQQSNDGTRVHLSYVKYSCVQNGWIEKHDVSTQLFTIKKTVLENKIIDNMSPYNEQMEIAKPVKMGVNIFYKIIRIVRAPSLVNSCGWMRVWKHGCGITRISIGYVLPDARFDWLVENMSVCREKLF